MKKIPTLFKRVFDDEHKVDILSEITAGCEDAFLHGKATIKMDGSCCAVIGGEFYRRYDANAKYGKTVPDGAIKCQEQADPVTGHLPCWIKCDRNNTDDKWLWKAYDNMIGKRTDGTYEAYGRHFNGNPYEMKYDILEKHGLREVTIERTFEAVKQFLAENDIEGLVFWLDNEPVCKIKRTDFGFSWNQHEERK